MTGLKDFNIQTGLFLCRLIYFYKGTKYSRIANGQNMRRGNRHYFFPLVPSVVCYFTWHSIVNFINNNNWKFGYYCA